MITARSRRLVRHLVTLSPCHLVILLLPVVLADGGAEEFEKARLLAKWKNDPVRHAHLKVELQAFLALPADKQERMRRLDSDLHAEEAAVRTRLWQVLERYASWSERLPAEDRQKIDTAPNPTERLRIVKEIHQRQWVERLPLATQERIKKTPEAERPALVAQLRAEERQRNQEWQVAIKHWEELIQRRPQGPVRLAQLPPAVREFVNESLLPMLSKADKERLQRAEGKWPLFPATLVDLADNNPMLSPGNSPRPARFSELPEEVRQRFPKMAKWPQPVRQSEGKWPDYAIELTKFARRRGIALPRPLGPARPDDFPPPTRRFLENKLFPALTVEETIRLKGVEGQWPEYPRLLVKLARDHNLVIPGMMLPGPRDLWDRFRTTARADDPLSGVGESSG